MRGYAEDWAGALELDDDSGEFVDPYPTLREALSPEYAELAPEQIESLVESMYPDVSAEDLESFFSSLKKVGRSVGRIAKRALPGVIQGATTGAALGPWGALAGGIAGGALSAATRGRGRATGGRRVSRPGAPGARASGPVPGRAALSQLAGSPAATQLLRTLGRPEVNQALMALAMGGAGRGNVKIGNVSVPTGAITSTLRRLLERAETELHESRAGEATGTPLYLLDEAGEFLVDPTDEDQRADLVSSFSRRRTLLPVVRPRA